MRRLVHIPIVHSEADMGSVRDKVRHAYISQRGRKAWEESRQAIAEFWGAVEMAVGQLHLDDGRIDTWPDVRPSG